MPTKRKVSLNRVRRATIEKNARHKSDHIKKSELEVKQKAKHKEKQEKLRRDATRRKREERARYTKEGLVSVTVRIKPSDKERLHQYVEGLNKNDDS